MLYSPEQQSRATVAPALGGVLHVQEMMALMDASFTGTGAEGALYDSGDESVHSTGSGGGRRGGSGHGARPPGEALALLQGHMLLEPYNVPVLVSGLPPVYRCPSPPTPSRCPYLTVPMVVSCVPMAMPDVLSRLVPSRPGPDAKA